MAELAEYVDLSDQALDILDEVLLKGFVESSASIIRDAIVEVIEEGDPSGRTYKVPGTDTTYTASAPGEPPAVREGVYRSSWAFTRAVREGSRIIAGVHNSRKVGEGEAYALWSILEFGTTPIVGGLRVQHVIAPRPHVMVGLRRARSDIQDLADQLSV